MITSDDAALEEAYQALMIIETDGSKRAFLRALRPGVLNGIADMVHVEWEGLREQTKIDNIMTEFI